MSGYFHFPNNLKDIKDFIQVYTIFFFPIKRNSFLRTQALIVAILFILQ